MIGYGYVKVTREIGHQLPNPCPIGEFEKALASVQRKAEDVGIDVSKDNAMWVRADEEHLYVYFEKEDRE